MECPRFIARLRQTAHTSTTNPGFACSKWLVFIDCRASGPFEVWTCFFALLMSSPASTCAQEIDDYGNTDFVLEVDVNSNGRWYA
jgi:hypothetical protein